MYLIKMMGGERFSVTDEEFQVIALASTPVFIKSCKSVVNPKSISAMYPEHIADKIENRKELQHGVLHDGTRVKRNFGQIVDADRQVVDDNGKYCPVRLNPEYYPEVALDLMFTEEEFERVKTLSSPERLELLIGRHEDRLKRISYSDKGLEKITFNK